MRRRLALIVGVVLHRPQIILPKREWREFWKFLKSHNKRSHTTRQLHTTRHVVRLTRENRYWIPAGGFLLIIGEIPALACCWLDGGWRHCPRPCTRSHIKPDQKELSRPSNRNSIFSHFDSLCGENPESIRREPATFISISAFLLSDDAQEA